MKIVISGIGCALADFVYNGLDFNNSVFKKYSSLHAGDGGLSPGKLVFTHELEKFAGKPYAEILDEITQKKAPDTITVGGPSLVSLIHAAQLTDVNDFEVKYFGMSGNDNISENIRKIVRQTPLNIANYLISDADKTPFTHVLSDPDYDDGHGERTFINNIGAAWNYNAKLVNNQFFNSHITCFGGTALVPQIHDSLSEMLTEAKQNGCITLVNTVFDFRNEKKNPHKPWPLVNKIDDYQLIDILIMDGIEAIKISGEPTVEEAALFFSNTKLSSFIITNGADNIYAWSNGTLFSKTELFKLPVSEKVKSSIKAGLLGDTTGCGDNFVGGIIASLGWQLKEKRTEKFDLTEAITWGVASGGFTCFFVGGTYIEKKTGEKITQISELRNEYLKQIGI